MDPKKPTSPELAIAQWEGLHDLFVDLGHRLDQLEPMPGSPGLPAVSLTLIDPRFHHRDTTLAVLDADTARYYPQAFSAESREVLAQLRPDAITASDHDAVALSLNAVSDGRHAVKCCTLELRGQGPGHGQ